jgi:hypothetical protein
MSEHDAASTHEWEVALERLEVQLNRAERMGTVVDARDLELGLPASLSTIPRYLLARAQSLVERQQRLSSAAADRSVDGFTLHDRVGHLFTGPREPVSMDIFRELEAERPSG